MNNDQTPAMEAVGAIQAALVAIPPAEWLQGASKRFAYIAETGFLVNLKNGKTPKPTASGYIRCSFAGRSFGAHQMAWYLHYGEWPPTILDHKNRIRDDNRIENLRLASYADNCRNMVPSKPPMSGYRGVYLKKHRGGRRIESAISFQNKKYLIGYHKTLLEAAAAYNQKATELFGEFAILNAITTTQGAAQ